MSDMNRDPKIERAFERYFDGVEEPKVDLIAAKEELRASARRKADARRRLRWQLPALAAALFVLVAVGIRFLPGLLITRYSIDETAKRTAELEEAGAVLPGGLGQFALADNAQAEFTVYSLKGEEVLLSANLRMLSGLYKFEATVWADLSDGKCEAEELSRFKDLEKRRGYSYRYEFENGEYVYLAAVERDGERYFIDYTAQESRSFELFMEKFF